MTTGFLEMGLTVGDVIQFDGESPVTHLVAGLPGLQQLGPLPEGKYKIIDIQDHAITYEKVE